MYVPINEVETVKVQAKCHYFIFDNKFNKHHTIVLLIELSTMVLQEQFRLVFESYAADVVRLIQCSRFSHINLFCQIFREFASKYITFF